MRTGFLLLAVLTAGILCAAHPFRVDLRNADCFAEGNGTVPISGENIRFGRIGGNGLWGEGKEPLRADRWSRISFTFTPARDGSFDLWLRGPWRKPKGAKEIERLEVIYDRLELSGATLRNGDFESASAADPTLPEHWRRVGKGAVRVENAVSGQFGAKVWHDGTLAQKIAVKAGVPVTLSFSARRDPDEAEKPVSVGAIPLTGWSGDTSLQLVPKAGVEALLPGKGKLFCSRQILVKPSTRYQLSFRYYSERSNLFYLELEEYDRAGRPLPRTDWMRHRDTFLRPDLSLRKTELQMELPFDTQPECASLRIEIRKLSAGGRTASSTPISPVREFPNGVRRKPFLRRATSARFPETTAMTPQESRRRSTPRRRTARESSSSKRANIGSTARCTSPPTGSSSAARAKGRPG